MDSNPQKILDRLTILTEYNDSRKPFITSEESSENEKELEILKSTLQAQIKYRK